MKLTHCSNLLKYIMMVLSFILIFACIFPFCKIDTDNLNSEDAALVKSVTTQLLNPPKASSQEGDAAATDAAAEGEEGPIDNRIKFNGHLGVLNYITDSTGVVKSSTLKLFSLVLLIAPVLMFAVFFLWRWVSDTVTGIIIILLAVVEMIFIFLFSGAGVSALNAELPELASFDILQPTLYMVVTLIADGVLFLLGVLLTLWNTLFKVKNA